MRKTTGIDQGKLYAMKTLKKETLVAKVKTAEHTKTERQVGFRYFLFVQYDSLLLSI